jgi:hypothetical protein
MKFESKSQKISTVSVRSAETIENHEISTKIAQHLYRLASLGQDHKTSANFNENQPKSLPPRFARPKAQKIMKFE